VINRRKASLFKKGLSENLLRKGFIANFFKKSLIKNASQRKPSLKRFYQKQHGGVINRRNGFGSTVSAQRFYVFSGGFNPSFIE